MGSMKQSIADSESRAAKRYEQIRMMIETNAKTLRTIEHSPTITSHAPAHDRAN
jgi:hypothetical protein